MDVKKFQDESENVIKYVFTKDDVCYEAVLYKYPTYEERTVLCISTQCGCPVGCTFCGTGDQFVRNLDYQEIYDQVNYVFRDIGFLNGYAASDEFKNSRIHNVKKLQIMFMSMGEPFLNYKQVIQALCELNLDYPTADMLISTIGPYSGMHFKDFLYTSRKINKIGLQFSIHKSNDAERDNLIPLTNKMSLWEIRNYGVEWYAATGRQVFLNYCIDGVNSRWDDYDNLKNLFPPNAFAFTFSVICSSEETMKDAGYRNMDLIESFQEKFIKDGYNCRIFDPAGQDSIGGGCGQLWYVQNWMKENKNV